MRRKSAQSKADLRDLKVTSPMLLCEVPDPTVPLWPYAKEFLIFLKPALFLECFSAISIPYNPQKHGHTDILQNGPSSTIRISINHQQGGMGERNCAKKTD